KYIERVWGAAGFRVVEWIPSGTLFPQALVFMIRTGQRPAFGHISVRTRAVAPTANRVARGLARRGKRLLRGSR
ncbi:MAG: hypothetical protein QOK10_1567, partial [Pseudonocardiales bacterium]|nr:hypothetical protein [Pseudonocardiales bacterium]